MADVGRLVQRASALGLAAGLVLAMVPAAAFAAEPEFGRPTASSTFLTGIAFEQPLETGLESGTTVEIVIEQAGSNTSFVVLVDAAARATTLRYELETPSGAAVPGTVFSARWRLTPAGGDPVLGPRATVAYDDDRFAWRTVAGDVVRMHWYEGNADFGRAALAIAEAGVRDAVALLGVDQSEPIDFYLYADVEPFYDAIGPGSRENVGGVAYSDVRTMLAQIDPGDLNQSWIRTVIPHELMHIVFATAVENPYHGPPKWLNEGLAVYQSEGYRSDRRGDVEAAASNDTLMPLSALVGQFPTSFDRFVLAYAESVSAVDYLVRTYGREELVALVRSYAEGVSDDAAFEAALGVDVTEFEAGWLADLGASAPPALGPQPAPPGPVPPGWEVAPTPAPGPTAIPTPAPTPATSPRPEEPAEGERGVVGVVAGVAVLAVLLLGAGWWWRRTRPPDDGTPAGKPAPPEPPDSPAGPSEP
ncbi:MAG: hypothetical protein L0221_13685 [Chloroflexi bacterium]|nr:hypothetical protein [Chloroflexota bacterium]